MRRSVCVGAATYHLTHHYCPYCAWTDQPPFLPSTRYTLPILIGGPAHHTRINPPNSHAIHHPEGNYTRRHTTTGHHQITYYAWEHLPEHEATHQAWAWILNKALR